MYKVISKGHKEAEKYLPMIEELDKEYKEIPEAEYYVVENHHRVIAYAAVVKEGEEYLLHKIYVEEGERYHSVGTKLLNYIGSSAQRGRVDRITTSFGCTDERTTFFIKNSFREEEDSYILDGIQKRNERTKEGMRGTWVSIVINVVLAALKIIVGFLGNSRALIADGFHSVSDVVGSVVILFSVHFGSAPEDEDHPYGHEKIECIAGNIVGVILVLTAFELTRDSLINLFSESEFTTPSGMTIAAAFISIIVKYWLYIYKINIGKRTKNDAIIADAREHRSDAISSIGVMVGLILAIYVNPVFDTLLGILVSLFIGKEGISIILDTSNTLLDKQDKEFIDEIESYVRENSDISNIHDTLMRVSGDKVFLSFHIRLPKEMTVYDAHTAADDLKYSLLNDFDGLKDVTIHIDYIID